MPGSELAGWCSVKQCLGAGGQLKWKWSSLVDLHGEYSQSSSPLVYYLK